MGTYQHGHNNDCTNAAIKAIKSAISNNFLIGLSEIFGLKEPKDMIRIKSMLKLELRIQKISMKRKFEARKILL